MEGPFSRNRHWYQQPEPGRHPFSRSPSVRGVPIYQVDPIQETRRSGNPTRSPAERKSGPRVVQIPVHVVGSKEVDRSGSALKIQNVFRGFLVRKCLKKIKEIKFQVDEIEERLSKREVVELVRRDERERLRLNESLMSSLFKLDSICGVDFGVRVCRKAVIRKAIALQERIDAIVGVHLGENSDQETEIRVPEETQSSTQSVDPVEPKDSFENAESPEGLVECQHNLEGVTCCDQQGGEKIMEFEENDGEIKVVDVGVDREVKVSDSNRVHENLDLEKVDYGGDPVEDEGKSKEANRADDNKRNQELLERMMEDNEKMMKLMTQLCKRDKAQTRMVNALTHRVELLEKAFACDKLRNKKNKKKKVASCRED